METGYPSLSWKWSPIIWWWWCWLHFKT